MFLLAGCGSRPPVPVGERSAPVVVEAGAAGRAAAPQAAAVPREGFYIVKKGDTLRKIAQEHGLSWRDVADWNSMTDPSRIEVGQELRIVPPEGVAIVKPIEAPAPLIVTGDTTRPPPVVSVGDGVKRDPKGGKVPYSETALAEVKTMEGGVRPATAKPADKAADKPAPPATPPVAVVAEGVDWTWPVGGKVLGEFIEGNAGRESNKGIDIAGRMGEPIQAAAAGKVTFVGNLRGYGDFLVVRHNDDFISVYAHTSKILVKKDQTVARGQKIAEVGSSDADQPKLHFEIRQQGRPVDPLKLLPAR
jgi:lipoprotein NlpD